MEIPGYTVHRELGSGGMSTVYLATQKSFGRKVAMKVLLPGFACNKDFTARFSREAKIVAGLSHPHIVPVYDVGEYKDYYYISMDYLSGGDLMQWIQRGLEEEEILQIIEDIASALHYAHGKGYIHRDIKPDNIMFREDNSAVLTDFGIARLQNANDQVTQGGAVVGTPKYMAPEIMQGLDIDGRVDVYSLGIVFYEMLMKEPPYQSTEYMALAMKHIEEPIPQLPPRFEMYQGLLERCIAKKPQDRFQNGLELVKAIKKIRKGESLDEAEELPSTKIEGELTPDLEEFSVGDYSIKHDTEERDAISPILDEEEFILIDEKLINEQAERISHTAYTPRANVPVKTITPPTEKVKKQDFPKEQTVFGEELVGRLMFKKYFFVCDITVYDVQSFSIIFSSATNKLLEWAEDREGKIAGFKLIITSRDAVFDRAKVLLENLYDAGGPYKFLKKSSVVLVMRNIETGEEETETL